MMSPLCGLLSFVILLQAYRKACQVSMPRVVWLLLSLACLFGAGADISWGIYEGLTGLDPGALPPVVWLYTMTNIFLAAGVTIFVIAQFRRWHGAKAILDAVVYSLAVMVLLWALFMDRSGDAVEILIQDGVSSAICIFSDFFIYLMVAIWYLSIRGGKLPVFLRFMMGGTFLFAVMDLFYYNALYYGKYIPNSVTDSLYIAGLLLIAASALFPLHLKAGCTFTMDSTYSNKGRLGKEIVILLIPVVILVLKGFILWELVFYFVLYIVYTSLGTYIQASMLNEELLQREKKMNAKLSEIVAERTQKLLEANKEL
jgi:hypothetical protein